MEYKWQEDIEACLQSLGLDPRWSNAGGKPGWSIRCPNPQHNDKGYDRNRSAFCFADNGFIYCFSGCKKGMNINTLMGRQIVPLQAEFEASQRISERRVQEDARPLGDFTAMWLDLEPLPNDFELKGVPALELNKRGWRKYEGGEYPPGIFIPYFNTTRDKVVFYQIRHNDPKRRFTFPTGAKQTCYGWEQLPQCKRYLCFTEGSRDSVILGMVGVPAIAFPSANSADMLSKIVAFCSSHNLIPVAVCDCDEAGEKFLQSTDSVVLDARVPVGKDVGEFMEQRGIEAVRNYYRKFATM